MNQRPLISVCIPCYNGAQFIGRTLRSVLAQTYTNFELIIADDRSIDDTAAIIATFGDNRIKFTQNPRNLGLGANWNHVLSQSQGKYVKLLCEDDLLHPECLTRQVQILEHPANSRAVLTVCNRRVIDANDKILLSRGFPFRAGLVSGSKLIRKSIRCGSNIIGEPAVGLFKREVLERTRMCDVSNPYLSDLSLWAQLLKHGEVYLDNVYLAAFRVSNAATTSKIGLGQAAAFRRFARTLREDSFYRLSKLDLLSGCVFSFQWCLLRNLFIKVHSCRRPRSKVGSSDAAPFPVLAAEKNCQTASQPMESAIWLNSRAEPETQIVMQR